MDATSTLQSVKADFAQNVAKDATLRRILKDIQTGEADFEDVYEYSRKLGQILGNSLEKFALEIPETEYNMIISEVLPEMLAQNHNLVTVAGKEVQKIIDDDDGIALGAVESKVNSDKVDGIVKALTGDGVTKEASVKQIKVLAENFTESSFDDFIQSNAAFRFDIGMQPQIIRTYEGPHKEHTGNGSDRHKSPNYVDCEWCKNLAGTYNYEDVKDTGNDVFRRHKGCHCQVIYKNNAGRYLQNAHTKKNY